MKKLISLAASVLLLTTANSAFAQAKFTSYGQEFKKENVKTMNSLMKDMQGKDKLENISLEGRISEVCQAEGCWVKLKNTSAEGAEDILVKFKDHAFVVPKDLAGKPMIVHGTALRKTVSVEEQRHMAEDAGKSADEIAKINTPKEELRIEATGVQVVSK